MTTFDATVFWVGFVMGMWGLATDGMDPAERDVLRRRLVLASLVAIGLACTIGLSADVIMPLPDCDRILAESGYFIWFMLGCWAF